MGAPVQRVFVNRVMMHDPGDCSRCKRAKRWQMYTLQKIRSITQNDMYIVPEVRGGVSGRTALTRFTRSIWRMA
jgi:hypothetical protein